MRWFAIFPDLPIAVLIVLAQLASAMLSSGHSDLAGAYQALVQWDGYWFGSIVENGYDVPIEQTTDTPGNSAFFPGYPIAVRAMIATTGWPVHFALPATAQLSCVIFWWGLLTLMRCHKVVACWRLLALGLFACHPCAFFLVASYSESQFLAAVIWFVIFCQRPGTFGVVAAIVCGVVLTGTRTVGLPLVVYPLVQWSLDQSRNKVGFRRAVVITLLSCLGFVAYAIYLQIAHGHWNAFTHTQRIGWNVQPDLFVFFRLETYNHKYVEVIDCHKDIGALNRMAFVLTLAHFMVLIMLEVVALLRGIPGYRVRLPLLYLAFALFVIPCTTHIARGYGSMARLALAWHALMPVIMAHHLQIGALKQNRFWVVPIIIGGAFWGLWVQWPTVCKYTSGFFVG